MNYENSEEVAIKALAWLASSEELLPIFLGSTGARIEDLRALAEDPAFLCSVLGFITMDDNWVVAFCDASEIAYEIPARAQVVLAGPSAMHWT